MDACTVETGLLKKKPCGEQAVTKCGNCEQSLCKKHAVPQVSAGQRKSGGFLCPECAKAWKAQEKAGGSDRRQRWHPRRGPGEARGRSEQARGRFPVGCAQTARAGQGPRRQ